jgi:biopolymer transport protein ExbD
VLVLLIIFMVIIPNMQDGKPIEMVNVFNPDPDAEAKDDPLDRHDRPQRTSTPSTSRTELTRVGAIAELQAGRTPATRSASC